MTPTAQVTVRTKQRTDAPAVLDLARRLPEWFNTAGLVSIEQDAPAHTGLVALDGDALVGFVLSAPRGNATTEITWMGVDPARHRQGVGRRLLDELERRLARDGVRSILVSTVADSVDYAPYARTRAFYRACGFRDHRVDAGFFKDPKGDYDRLMMERRLAR